MARINRWTGHGTELAPTHAPPDSGAAAPAGPAARLRETAATGYELGRLYRLQLTPWGLMGATYTLGYAATAAPGGYTLIPAAVAVAAGVWGCVYGRDRARRRPENRAYPVARAWRIYTVTVAAAAVGWVLAAAAVGRVATAPMLASLLAGGLALGVPWWRAHAEPDPDVTAEQATEPDPEPEPEPEPEPGPRPERRVELWNQHVGVGTMSEVTDMTFGWWASVELPIGTTYKWLQQQQTRDLIATVYGLPAARVYPQSIPDTPMNWARISVITRDPLRQTVAWTGPSLDPGEGTFPLMTAIDGSSLPFRFWTPGDGSSHALVAGTTRSGKSSTLNLITAEAMCADRLIPLVIDIGGVSLPYWIDQVLLAATTHADAQQVLTWVFTVLNKRATVLRQRRGAGGGSLTPTPQMPGIVLIIDEAHNVIKENPVLRRMVERLAQEGAKYGCSLVLSTQSADITQLGGESTTLRDMLKSGTVIGHRTTESGNDNKLVVGDAPPENLRDLPAEWPDGSQTRGLGYMLTAARKLRARSMFLDTDPASDSYLADLPSWLHHTRLDTDSHAPPPTLRGDSDPPDGPDDLDHGPPQDTPDPGGQRHLHPVPDRDSPHLQVLQDVQQALNAGTGPDPTVLAQATGHPLPAVIHALAEYT